MADLTYYPSTNRPVFSRLPAILREPEDPNLPIANWITDWLDQNLFFIQARAWEFAYLYTNPANCPAEYLDWLADLIWADPKFWDSSWTEDQKRRILINARRLRETRGSAKTFRWLLSNFSLLATLEPSSGWIVSGTGTASPLPASLAGGPFSWRVTIDSSYIDSTPQYELILKLIENWLPCWVDVEIVRP